MITILAGGTGSVKMVRGFAAHDQEVTVISNVGDNYWSYGMYVCPDIDTIIYGLSGNLDEEKGWGVKKDTNNFLRQMEMFGEETWFRIGDRDAATHLTRTNMLKNGKNLSEITQWMCEKFAVESKVIPITDNTVETRITANGEDLHLQEFWVKHRGRGEIEGIQYIGAEKARPNPAAISAIQDAELVILAPGNPLTSIGPMLGIKGVRKELTKNKKKVVSVSPLVGNKSFSGPADKYMEAAGIEVSVFGLAQMYADVCSKMVIDSKDKAQASKIKGLDIQVFDTKLKMQNKMAEEALAAFILKQLKL